MVIHRRLRRHVRGSQETANQEYGPVHESSRIHGVTLAGLTTVAFGRITRQPEGIERTRIVRMPRILELHSAMGRQEHATRISLGLQRQKRGREVS